MLERGGILQNTRGQVTIFIIIAIVIVGIALLYFYVRPNLQVGAETNFQADNPQGFVQNCLEENVGATVEKISLQGGSLEPEFATLYQGNTIEYLCYTSEDFQKNCVVQQPMLKQHIESEIRQDISDEIDTCFNSLRENYANEGYQENLQKGDVRVELLPKRIIINFENYTLTTTKGETNRYDAFDVIINNNLYELVSIVNSIIEWESTYGDAETTLYMSYYRDLKVEKTYTPNNDGTKIYTLTDRNTGDIFQFASRSGVFPAGFGKIITNP